MLLADNGMRGVMALEIAAEHALGVAIGGGDGVESERTSLVLDGNGAAEARKNDVSGEVGERVRGVQEGRKGR
jgi:hypothetical protein